MLHVSALCVEQILLSNGDSRKMLDFYNLMKNEFLSVYIECIQLSIFVHVSIHQQFTTLSDYCGWPETDSVQE